MKWRIPGGFKRLTGGEKKELLKLLQRAAEWVVGKGRESQVRARKENQEVQRSSSTIERKKRGRVKKRRDEKKKRKGNRSGLPDINCLNLQSREKGGLRVLPKCVRRGSRKKTREKSGGGRKNVGEQEDFSSSYWREGGA